VSSLKKQIGIGIGVLLFCSLLTLVSAETISYETEDYSVSVSESELGGLRLNCSEGWNMFVPAQKIENITSVNSSAFFFSTTNIGYYVIAVEDGEFLFRNMSNEVVYKEVCFLDDEQFLSVILLNSTEYLALNNLKIQKIELLEYLGGENSSKSLILNKGDEEAQVNYSNETSKTFNLEDFGISTSSSAQVEREVSGYYGLLGFMFFGIVFVIKNNSKCIN